MSNNDSKETVLVAQTKTGGERKYHTCEDCQYVFKTHSEWSLSMAKGWGFEKCSRCVEMERQREDLKPDDTVRWDPNPS